MQSKKLSRSATAAADIALAAVKAISDLDTSHPTKKWDSNHALRTVLEWQWKPDAIAGLVDALSTLHLQADDLSAVSKKVHQALHTHRLCEEDYLLLGKRILGKLHQNLSFLLFYPPHPVLLPRTLSH